MNRDEIIAKARAAAEDLRTDCIAVTPEDFDFGDGMFDEDGEERWSYLEAVQCEDCDQIIVTGEEHGYVDVNGDAVELPADVDDADVERELLTELATVYAWDECPRTDQDAQELYAEGPMMNYRYPLNNARDHFTNDDARKIYDLPLCLVEQDGHDYLALTGGGMDLSWEICQAYIRLGYLPPTHFDLPSMAGMVLTESTALVIAAVERANKIQTAWAQRGVERAVKMFDLPLPDETTD